MSMPPCPTEFPPDARVETREAAHRVPVPPTSVLNTLQAKPGTFALAQAVELALRQLRVQGLTPEQVMRGVCYRVNPDLSFPPGDIAALRLRQLGEGEAHPGAFMVLNLMGLHGAASPIPAYFAEHVAQHQDEADALRDFFDIFHQQFGELLHTIWRKYRYYLWFETGAGDAFSTRFSGFMGIGHSDLRGAKKLRWQRLMAYMGLIAFNAESAGSLESILRHYFSHAAVSIVPCIHRWVCISSDQCVSLGHRSSCIGKNFLLGEEVPDQTGKFRVRIDALTWQHFNEFLPSGEKFQELQTLIKFVLRSQLDFDVELRLLPEEIHPWRLEEHNPCRLGWSMWAGEGGDGIVVLETEHREL